MNGMRKIHKALWAIILAAAIVFVPFICKTPDLQASATSTVAQLKAKFPDGKYWNHYVTKSSEAADVLGTNKNESFSNTTTSHGCALHGKASSSYYVGKYDCNYFDGGWQCFGFARKLGYEAYGKRVSTWSTTTSLSGLKAGDVIRYKYGSGEHSIFVISVSGSTVTVGECNWRQSNSEGHCIIHWGRTVNLNSVTIILRYIAPYELNAGSTPSRTVDSRYPTPFKAYNLANGKTPAYTADGTSVGYVYADDECVIQEVYTDGWCKVKCPWSGYSDGRIVYCQLSTFIASGYTPSSKSVSTQTTTYTRSNASTSYGYIGAGDTVTVVGSSGAYSQVIYPLTAGGYKCAWAILPTSTPTTAIYDVPFKCRIISTTKVRCYYDINYSTPSTPVYVYPDDDCVITAIYENGKVQCSCPWSDGTTKTVYLDKSAFIDSNSTPLNTTAPKYAKTYLRTDMATNIGWIDPGNNIQIVATSGDKTQIIYPADVGKRCAWVYTSDLKQTYTVSYNANGGTGAPSSQTKTNGTVLTISSTVPTRTGYKFLGWATSSSATSAQYAAGGAFTSDENVTLYAVWKANQYNVSFDANGGQDAPNPQTKVHDTDLVLSSVKPTRIGYTFLGWATGDSASSAEYLAGGKYTKNASVTLYAVWKANTYKISYNANGGTSAPASQTKVTDVALKLTIDVPARTGYTFIGWSESSSAAAADYIAGDMFYNDSDTTLYAVWKINTYTVKYDLNGGTGSIASQTKTHGTDLTLTSSVPTRTGYTFVGWSESKSAGSAEYISGGKFSKNADTTLYAVWKINTYTVKYDLNGGTGSIASQTKTYGKDLTLTSAVPTKTGYTFVGWSESKSAESAEYISGGKFNKNANTTLYAVWKVSTPKIAGDINGDGVVNGKDLTRLRKYLAGQDVQVNEDALDVNGDGVVNGKDLTRLLKYIAGQDVQIY